jgi:threonine synthase
VDVALPRATPEPFRRAIAAHGGRWHDVEGDIAEAGEWLRSRPQAGSWFFLSTLREPYRVEGKKTMGYEIVEARGGTWPDAVLYPTGGGTGIVGMAKAVEELRALGLAEGPGPRWVVVQMEGCAPLVRAFEAGASTAARWAEPRTCAYGLRVPATLGDAFLLRAVRESGGTAVAVAEGDLARARRDLGALEGIYAAPEAAATLLAARRLREAGWLRPEWSVVLFLTGSGFLYPEAA